MIHPTDVRAPNPRMQCDVCGRWSRLHVKRGPYPHGNQFIYGSCNANAGGDHTAAGAKQDVCNDCCREKCAPQSRGN